MLTITQGQLTAMAQAAPGTRMIQPCASTATWIGIELRDDDDSPVTGERYCVLLPDSSRIEGRLDREGRAHIDGIVPGTCQVSFPDIDAREWFPA